MWSLRELVVHVNTRHIENQTKENLECQLTSLSSCVFQSGDLCLKYSMGHCQVLIYLTLVQKDQIRSVAQLCPTLCDSMNHSMPGLPVHHQHVEFAQSKFIESGMPSSHTILCCPLLLLPPVPPTIRVFSNESTLCIRWPKYWNFSFSIILPMNTQD